jgi:hypothetical protein
MSDITRAILDALLPPGSIWTPEDNADFDKLLEGIADNHEEIRIFLSQLSTLRDPDDTLILDDLEREYGSIKDKNLSESLRRQRLNAIAFARNGGGTSDFLQQVLRDAGFDVFVYNNDPAVDPALFLNETFQMVAGGGNAYAGYQDAFGTLQAFAGRSGGELVVNGDLLASSGPLYLSVANTMYAGQTDLAFAGHFDESFINRVEYDIPVDPDAWPFVFFVSGEKVDILYANAFYGVAYGLNTFVIVGAAGEIQTSLDGESWQKRPSDNSFADNFFGITFNNGIFVTVGDAGEIQTSSNSRNWFHRIAGGSITTALHDVTFGNGVFVTVGESGEIQTSVDGINWIPRTAAGSYSDDFNGVTYNGTLFVAVGNAGEIQTSSDGITWTVRTPAGGYSDDFRACTNNGSLFVIVGENAEIQTSSDGITWTARTPAGAYAGDFEGATFGIGSFVITGTAGEIQTSSDGITWTAQTADGSYTDTFQGAGFGNNIFIINGDNAEIQKSTLITLWNNKLPGASSFDLPQAEIPSEREQEFKRFILRIKPLYTWAAIIVTYV